MKKLYVSITIVLLIVSIIASTTYAWFTYVERKSLAAFEAGELSITMKANDSALDFDINLDDLAFIDYQNEVILDKYQTFNHMASSVKVDIISDELAPLSKHYITIDETNLIPGLMYVIIFEGVNIDPLTMTTDYHTYVTDIIGSYATKTEQLAAIDTHNQQKIDEMYQQVLLPTDTLTFQIVVWGDYDELSVSQDYLDETFVLSLIVDSINDKGRSHHDIL